MAEAEDTFGAMLDDDGLGEADEALLEGDAEAGAAGPGAAAAPTQVSDDPFDVLYKFHPETILRYQENILPLVPLQAVPPGALDANHTSPPFLTDYERTKILGTRTGQLADGARPLIAKVPDYVTKPLDIAKMELEQRLLPFIIERPMPDGTCEYWRLSDLMIL